MRTLPHASATADRLPHRARGDGRAAPYGTGLGYDRLVPITLPACLQDEDDGLALSQLRRYFRRREDGHVAYAGALWDGFDPSGSRARDADRFTADDVASLRLLSVSMPGRAMYELLVTDSPRFNEMLEGVGADRDLGSEETPICKGDPAWELHVALKAFDGVGPTIASKLLARKRPRLLPIRDSVVVAVMQLGDLFWEPLRVALRTDGLDDRLGRLHDAAGLPPEVSRLRVLDVLTWMQGST